MRKIRIHIEKIKKAGAKLQFQIKLPSTTKKVTGIIITAHPEIQNLLPPGEGEEPPTGEKEQPVGWVWLRIPEKRDVFYADFVKFPNHKTESFHGISQEGIAQKSEWWFKGTKRDFFKVEIPIEDTIIEGFYEDRSTDRRVDYQLKIYLELEIK